MEYAAIISAAVSLIGAAMAAGDNAKAQSIREDTAKKIGAINLPVLDKIVAQRLPPDSIAKYEKITQAGAAENEVLGKYQQEVNAHGETDQDRAAYLRAQDIAQNAEAGGRSAILRQMATRGMGNSGVAYALENANAQGAGNMASRAGIEEAGAARQRYMQALGQYGSLAGQMRGQEMARYKAEDDINMFNARQQNEADKYNAGLNQQQYENMMRKAQAQGGANASVAGGYEKSAGATQQTANGVAQSAATFGSAYDAANSPRYDANGNLVDANGKIIKYANSGSNNNSGGGQGDWYNDSGGYATG